MRTTRTTRTRTTTANLQALRPRHPSAALAALTALAAAAALTAYAPAAHADEVSPTGKGIVGGALLGAEVVTITESLFNVRPIWAYGLGAGLGALGGGVGGYFVEQSSTDGRVPVYMLAGGLALIIPALVLTLNATRYQADANATEDRAPTNGPTADPSAGGSLTLSPAGATTTTDTSPTTPQPSPTPATASPNDSGAGGGTTPTPPHGPAFSLLDVTGGAMRVGVPVPTVKQMWSTSEQAKLGLKQGAELRLPLFAMTF